MCDPGLRTVNTGAECGSDKDSYYYSPWRAPGSAPVLDSCGMAGGAPSWGHHGAQYRASSHAKQGDKGSFSLPQNVSGLLLSFYKNGLSCILKDPFLGRLDQRCMFPGLLLPIMEEDTSTDCVQQART